MHRFLNVVVWAILIKLAKRNAFDKSKNIIENNVFSVKFHKADYWYCAKKVFGVIEPA